MMAMIFTVIPITSKFDTEPPDRKLQAEIDTVLIGKDLALATFPGEFFVEHGLAFKERSPFKHTFFIDYCNDQLYYFPTIQYTITWAGTALLQPRKWRSVLVNILLIVR
jgi:hypothetical protein